VAKIITYPFRILLENNSGHQESYANDSFITMDYSANTGISKSLEEMTSSIELMHSCSYAEAPGASWGLWSTSSYSDNAIWSNFDELYFSQSSYMEVGTSVVRALNSGGSFDTYSHLKFAQPTASIHIDNMTNFSTGNRYSASLVRGVTDPLYKYKFYGSKVCDALGLPENQWIYTDVFRVSNRSDRPHNFGDSRDTELIVDKLYVRQGLSLSSQGTMKSNLPFQIDESTDRLIYFK